MQAKVTPVTAVGPSLDMVELQLLSRAAALALVVGERQAAETKCLPGSTAGEVAGFTRHRPKPRGRRRTATEVPALPRVGGRNRG